MGLIDLKEGGIPPDLVIGKMKFLNELVLQENSVKIENVQNFNERGCF